MEELTHSEIGIVSFTASIISVVFVFLLIVVAGVLEVTTPGGVDVESDSAIIVGLFLFAFVGVLLIALGLGIVGLMQKDRKITFAILGTVFSSVALVSTVALYTIGALAE